MNKKAQCIKKNTQRPDENVTAPTEGSSNIRTPRQDLSDGEIENDTVESEKARNGQDRTTSRERRQRRAAHRSHEQIQLLRTIARWDGSSSPRGPGRRANRRELDGDGGGFFSGNCPVYDGHSRISTITHGIKQLFITENSEVGT